MGDRTLDRQVALLLGDEQIVVAPIDGPIGDMHTAWRDAGGHVHYTTDGGPPFYSADGEWGTAPLLLAEIEKRGMSASYVAALEAVCGIDLQANYEAAFALLAATPEQHCRAFVEVCG